MLTEERNWMGKMVPDFFLYNWFVFSTGHNRSVTSGSGRIIEIPEDFRQAARNTTYFCFQGKLAFYKKVITIVLFLKKNLFLIDNFIKYLFIYFERESPVFRFYRYVELYISGCCRVLAGFFSVPANCERICPLY